VSALIGGAFADRVRIRRSAGRAEQRPAVFADRRQFGFRAAAVDADVIRHATSPCQRLT